jgi:type IV secretion system protein VirB9
VRVTLAFFVAALIAVAQAEIVPAPGLLDARVRVAPYSAEQVYRLAGYVGYQTDLEFESGETFLGLGAGDIEGLSFVAQDNHLFLKPKAAKVGTNLTILTSRRTYQVDYSATTMHPDATEAVMYVLRFSYPNRAKDGDAADYALARDPHRPQNIDYWFCGNASIQPIAASDDGLHTRLTFAAKAEQPAIFILNDDGTESLLNFSMDEGDVILHRVARRFILRRGNLTGCVVNKGFTGSGERSKSNTVTEDVVRSTQGANP